MGTALAPVYDLQARKSESLPERPERLQLSQAAIRRVVRERPGLVGSCRDPVSENTISDGIAGTMDPAID